MKHLAGHVTALSVLRPGVANLTIETLEILPNGDYQASYKTASEEITGILRVAKYGAYQGRWRASGVFTRKWKRRRGIIFE
jgi:hypothetical protein